MTSKKNMGYSQYFNKEWFKKHQRTLLWLCNKPLVKYWFRYILRIHRDVGWNEHICQLQPNNYKVYLGWENGALKIKGDFRTHDKFSKRIYYAFEPLWWLAHAWDWLLADRCVPRWSFGFTTLTQYPDPHPETNSVDGYVFSNLTSVSWATLIADAGTGSWDDALFLELRIQAAKTTNLWSILGRLIAGFSTSSIGINSSIDTAVIAIRGSIKNDSLSIIPDVNVYSASPASNTAIVAGDYDSLGSTAFSTTITYAAFSDSVYNSYSLNANGIANINKAGISNFGFRNANYDVAATAPISWSAGLASYFRVHSADVAGTTSDPKLVIEYTLPQTLALTVIATAESFGTLTIANVADLDLGPDTIATGESFGTLNIEIPQILDPDTIVTAESFGTLAFSFFIVPDTIVSAEVFGTHTFRFARTPLVGAVTYDGVGEVIAYTAVGRTLSFLSEAKT